MFKKIIWISLCFGLLTSISSAFAVRDIMEIMFEPAKSYEKIVDLGSDKNQVGNEIFKESTQLGIDINLDAVCTVNGQKISANDITDQAKSNNYNWTNSDYCEKILGGSYEKHIISGSSQTQAPLIVRITKFLLRITMVLAITMVLYNGILRIIESAKWAEVKDAQNNIIYIIAGILVSLSSVALINLVSSISTSTITVETTQEKEAKKNEEIINKALNQAGNYIWDKAKQGISTVVNAEINIISKVAK